LQPWNWPQPSAARPACGGRAWSHAVGPPGQQRLVSAIALLLALLVFAPDVSVAGSWAGPAPVEEPSVQFEHGAITPAQLVLPTARSVPSLAQILLLGAVAAWLLGPRSPVALLGSRPREPIPLPGLRRHALLQAYLN
jgi:hypothetical protein